MPSVMGSSDVMVSPWDPFWRFVTDDYSYDGSVGTNSDVTETTSTSLWTENTSASKSKSEKRVRFAKPLFKCNENDAARDDYESYYEETSQRWDENGSKSILRPRSLGTPIILQQISLEITESTDEDLTIELEPSTDSESAFWEGINRDVSSTADSNEDSASTEEETTIELDPSAESDSDFWEGTRRDKMDSAPDKTSEIWKLFKFPFSEGPDAAQHDFIVDEPIVGRFTESPDKKAMDNSEESIDNMKVGNDSPSEKKVSESLFVQNLEYLQKRNSGASTIPLDFGSSKSCLRIGRFGADAGSVSAIRVKRATLNEREPQSMSPISDERAAAERHITPRFRLKMAKPTEKEEQIKSNNEPKSGFLRSIRRRSQSQSREGKEGKHIPPSQARDVGTNAATQNDHLGSNSRMPIRSPSSSLRDPTSLHPQVEANGPSTRSQLLGEETPTKATIPIKLREASFLTSRSREEPGGVKPHDCNRSHFSDSESSSPSFGFGRLLCRSEKSVEQHIETQIATRSFEDERDTGAFPVVRIVDSEGALITKNRSELLEQTLFPEAEAFVPSSGPQSIYTYEYTTGMPMDVSYKEFGDDPIDLLHVRQYNIPRAIYGGSRETIVKVEASTISGSDCRIRQGLWWGGNTTPLPITPGVDMVGIVDKIDPWTMMKYKINPGDRVMSLIKWGGNSRYARVQTDQLVKVPDGVDPAEAACLSEAYLAAFQALHYRQGGGKRYRDQSMVGKSVLVIGAMTNVGGAVVQLAKALGATNVYAIGKEKKHSYFADLGAKPLSRKQKYWLPILLGTMDLVIDATGDIDGDHANAGHFKALHEQGDLIFIGLRGKMEEVAAEWDGTETLPDADNAAELVARTHSLEVFDNWELDLEGCKRDLKHLLRMLSKKKIKPLVRDRLPLGKVAQAQQLLEMKQIRGYLVCEPWIKSKSRAVCL